MSNLYTTGNRAPVFDSTQLIGKQSMQFADDRRRLLEEPRQAEPKIRNVLIPRFDVKREDAEFLSLKTPLRISVEVYPGDECIATLVAEPTISGYGNTIDEAVNEAMTMFAEDLSFYVENDEKHMTQDAKELKAKLLSFFDMADGSRL